jgi:hypothetical protein
MEPIEHEFFGFYFDPDVVSHIGTYWWIRRKQLREYLKEIMTIYIYSCLKVIYIEIGNLLINIIFYLNMKHHGSSIFLEFSLRFTVLYS